MTFNEMLTATFLSLLPMINPIGVAPFFLSMTSHLKPEERYKTAYMVSIYSAVLLCCVLFFGRVVLGFFGLSLPFIKIAGGIIVAITAWQMLNMAPKLTKQEDKEHKDMMQTGRQMAFFPLTLPLTAGAGAIAITIAMALRIPDGISHSSVVMYAGGVAGILLMSLFVAVCYRFGGYIMDKLGTTGTNVVTRLSAFIIMAIGIAVIWDGLKPLILSLK